MKTSTAGKIDNIGDGGGCGFVLILNDDPELAAENTEYYMIYTYIRDVRIGDDDSYNAPQLLYGDYAAQHNR